MAYELGLVSGMGNDLFVPDRYATREQAAVMLSRLYDKLHPAQTATRPWSFAPARKQRTFPDIRPSYSRRER